MIDPIRSLMGAMPDEEHAARRRLLDYRDVATFRAHHTGGPNARGLLWMASSAATEHVFSNVTITHLCLVADLCGDLIEIAERANQLEADDGLANT